jgi:hypothetical protein
MISGSGDILDHLQSTLTIGLAQAVEIQFPAAKAGNFRMALAPALSPQLPIIQTDVILLPGPGDWIAEPW